MCRTDENFGFPRGTAAWQDHRGRKGLVVSGEKDLSFHICDGDDLRIAGAGDVASTQASTQLFSTGNSCS